MIGSNRYVENKQEDRNPEIPKKLAMQEKGKFAYVDDVNPFEGIDGNAFKLSSQLKDGVHLTQVSPRKLSKVHGADAASSAVEQIMSNSKKESK